jgi:hypothetical protein
MILVSGGEGGVLMTIPWAAQEPWVAILVMMLSVGFWIVSSLMKALAEPARPVRPGQAPPMGQGPVARAPLSLEEFLQEARRRRGEADAAPMATAAPAPELPAPEPTGVAADAAKRRKARKARDAASAPLTMDTNQTPELGPALPALPAMAALSATPEALSVLVQSTQTGQQQAQHPFNRFLSQVLSDRRNIQATILLGEVLGQPLCHKRRGLTPPRRPSQNNPE